ncbi:MAG: family 2 glycosyl transferase [Crocinitomicaceae bacterium]|nr:family 2 glycosyl transferase [Crocinitomicaceae bacterium]|tara:strand:- start:5751 stop:8558 length:2808 start_codon:yes stop_codon:yes gene_type:complete
MTKPSVSVVITLYNLGQYLQECVESVGDIVGNNIEVIIVNDGSTDQETLDVLDTFRNRSDIRIIDQENQGVQRARNVGIEQAQSDYILPLDADNKISPEYYLKAIEVLDANPKVGVVYGNYRTFGEREEERILADFEPAVFFAVNYIDNCAVFRKKVWAKIGGYDEKMPVPGYEDWDLWMGFYSEGFTFHHLNEFLFEYRIRENSLVSTANETPNRIGNYKYLINKYEACYIEHGHGIMTHFIKNLSEVENELFQSVEFSRQLGKDRDKLIQQLQHAHQSNLNLQQRINDFENSKLFKFKKQIGILLARFKSNSDKGKSQNIFRKIAVALSRKGRAVISKLLALVFKHLYLFFEETKVVIVEAKHGIGDFSADPLTRLLFKTLPDENELIRQKKEIDQFKDRPILSVLMPVYNPPVEFFKRAMDTILQQSYEYWELCLADDASTDSEIKRVIEEYRKRDKRIKVVYREENGHISAASNSAMEIAVGDFYVLMDQDDEIALDAFYWCVKAINENENIDLVYTDEDKIDEFGNHSEAHFKPDWSPDNLLSRNYLGHLTVFRSDLFREIGGWREGFEGSQDYDLVLRFTEKCRNITHIPRILYHWRIHSTSAAGGEDAKPYAYTSAQKAITEALTRRGYSSNIGFLDGFRGYSVRLGIKDPEAKVSIIIPTKDQADILETCLKSIFEKTSWQNFEVLVIDNNSSDQNLFDLLDHWTKKEPNRFKSIRTEEPFNFSFLMNLGARNTDGNYMVLLNNDTEVITEDWLEAMIEHAQRPEVGVVGAKLLYPNDTIQHAGVIIGLGGAAGHVLVGEHRDGPGHFNYVNLLNNYCAVTAACVMVRREVFDEVGGFNENFAVEYNDVDFCLKVWDTGYRNLYVPHCELYHHESVSRGHPHLTKESFEKHKEEIKKLKDLWQPYVDHDPCYNPNQSLGAHDFRMKS